MNSMNPSKPRVGEAEPDDAMLQYNKSSSDVNSNTLTRRHIEKIARLNKEYQIRNGLAERATLEKPFISDVPLQMVPDEVIFKDITPGQIYQMFVQVRNLTRYVKRVRVFQPKTSNFRCDYDMMGAIAPGLSIELIISFETSSSGEFRDSLRIVSDDDIEVEVPIFAFSPSSKIIFEPFVHLGFIQVGKPKKQSVRFRNEGSTEGKINLRMNINELEIFPSNKFSLQPGQDCDIDLVYTPQEAGIFRGLIEVICDGQTFLNQIDVNATCVEYLRFIINDQGEELTKLDFGTVLFGAKKKMRGYLVNNSPENFYFKMSYIQGLFESYQEENNLLSPQEVGEEQTRRILSVEPAEGMIESYAQIPLTFLCKSYVDDDHKIWTKSYNLAKQVEIAPIAQEYEYTAIFYFTNNKYFAFDPNSANSDESHKILMMSARAICPKVVFHTQHLDFGETKIGEEVSLDLHIENRNDIDEPIRIDCAPISQFIMEPKRLSLLPGENKIMKIIFKPLNLGNFEIKAKFFVERYYDIVVKLTGKSVAPRNNRKVI